MNQDPEIIFGLVGAVGTDLEIVCNFLMELLKEVNYKSKIIRLSSFLSHLKNAPWGNLPDSPEDERINKFMTAGDKFRALLKRSDALALSAIGEIRKTRAQASNDPNKPIPRQAYILWSLKHPSEIKTLRRIYGKSFILLSVYSSREKRKRDLAFKIAESHHEFQTSNYLPLAEKLILRDEHETETEYGQNVREAFPLADVFIDANDPECLRKSIIRFVESFFYNPYHSPTRDEFAMFHAKAAALRSSSLSRQVGAVISTPEGDIIAIGTNEVPKAGGGLYWYGDEPDHRDHKLGFDISDRMKKSLLGDVLERLKKANWLSPQIKENDIDELIEEALKKGESPLMQGAQLMNIIEFGRSVHAEMSAICDAARRGVSIKGCYLYTTTFPCHQCARHIVASGISKVFYIEPYPKSLVPELYPDSISIDSSQDENHVEFKPFVGISPRIYMDLFTAEEKRKGKDGRIIYINKTKAQPRLFEDFFPSLLKEEYFFLDFCKTMIENGFDI